MAFVSLRLSPSPSFHLWGFFSAKGAAGSSNNSVKGSVVNCSLLWIPRGAGGFFECGCNAGVPTSLQIPRMECARQGETWIFRDGNRSLTRIQGEERREGIHCKKKTILKHGGTRLSSSSAKQGQVAPLPEGIFPLGWQQETSLPLSDTDIWSVLQCRASQELLESRKSYLIIHPGKAPRGEHSWRWAGPGMVPHTTMC